MTSQNVWNMSLFKKKKLFQGFERLFGNLDPDPDPHQGEKSNPDPHQLDADPKYCPPPPTHLSGKVLSQSLQFMGFSLVWSFWTCSLRSVFRPHVVGHSSQWYTGLSPGSMDTQPINQTRSAAGLL
jgi:hypothetical protein